MTNRLNALRMRQACAPKMDAFQLGMDLAAAYVEEASRQYKAESGYRSALKDVALALRDGNAKKPAGPVRGAAGKLAG